MDVLVRYYSIASRMLALTAAVVAESEATTPEARRVAAVGIVLAKWQLQACKDTGDFRLVGQDPPADVLREIEAASAEEKELTPPPLSQIQRRVPSPDPVASVSVGAVVEAVAPEPVKSERVPSPPVRIKQERASPFKVPAEASSAVINISDDDVDEPPVKVVTRASARKAAAAAASPAPPFVASSASTSAKAPTTPAKAYGAIKKESARMRTSKKRPRSGAGSSGNKSVPAIVISGPCDRCVRHGPEDSDRCAVVSDSTVSCNVCEEGVRYRRCIYDGLSRTGDLKCTSALSCSSVHALTLPFLASSGAVLARFNGVGFCFRKLDDPEDRARQVQAVHQFETSGRTITVTNRALLDSRLGPTDRSRFRTYARGPTIYPPDKDALLAVDLPVPVRQTVQAEPAKKRARTSSGKGKSRETVETDGEEEAAVESEDDPSEVEGTVDDEDRVLTPAPRVEHPHVSVVDHTDNALGADNVVGFVEGATCDFDIFDLSSARQARRTANSLTEEIWRLSRRLFAARRAEARMSGKPFGVGVGPGLVPALTFRDLFAANPRDALLRELLIPEPEPSE